MNENQSAHGDREYGHIFSRLGMERKIVVGYWEDEAVQKKSVPGCVPQLVL